MNSKDKFVWSAGDIELQSSCFNCKHKFNNSEGCTAFDVIPNDILLGKNQHTKKHPKQDNDIVFEKVEYVEDIGVPNIVKLLMRDENFPFVQEEKVSKDALLSVENTAELKEYEKAIDAFPLYRDTVVYQTKVSGEHIFNIVVSLFEEDKIFRNAILLFCQPKSLFKEEKAKFSIIYYIEPKTGRTATMLAENEKDASNIVFKRGSLFEYKKSKIEGNTLNIYLEETVEEKTAKEVKSDKDVFGDF